jgi:hypothetical protein
MIEKRIVVTGDVTVDWNVAYHQPTDSDPRTAQSVRDDGRLSARWGGAALLRDVIAEIAKKNNGNTFTVDQVPPLSTKLPVKPTNQHYNHSFALWDRNEPEESFYRNHPRWNSASSHAHSTSDQSKRNVWRVRKFLGFSQRAPIGDSHKNTLTPKKLEHPPCILVIDDADYGFRGTPFNFSQATWNVLKLSRNIKEEIISKYLTALCPNKTVVVTSADDLRSAAAVQIRRSLSWEQTAQDVARELLHNKNLATLQQCRHVVISLGTSGAVLMSNVDRKKGQLKLIYDPQCLESAWEKED